MGEGGAGGSTVPETAWGYRGRDLFFPTVPAPSHLGHFFNSTEMSNGVIVCNTTQHLIANGVASILC